MTEATITSAVECIRRIRRKIQINPEHLFNMRMGYICKTVILEKGVTGLDEVRDVIHYFREKMREDGFGYYSRLMGKHYADVFLRLGVH